MEANRGSFSFMSVFLTVSLAKAAADTCSIGGSCTTGGSLLQQFSGLQGAKTDPRQNAATMPPGGSAHPQPLKKREEEEEEEKGAKRQAMVWVKRQAALGFPALDVFKDAESVRRRLMEVVRAGAGVPCRADVLSTSFTTCVGGFGSKVILFLDEVFAAMCFNKSLAVATEMPWQDRFSRLVPLEPCQRFNHSTTSLKCLPRYAKVGNHLMRGLLNTSHRELLIKAKGHLVHTFFTLNDRTRKQAMERWRRGGLNITGTFAGVHVRRGDKLLKEANRTKTESYVQALVTQVRKHNVSQIYVASDDIEAADEIRTTLAASGTDVPVASSYDASSSSRIYDSDDTVIPLLADFEALRESASFIGTQSSNMGRVVYFSRRAKDMPSTSLDGEWGDFFWA